MYLPLVIGILREEVTLKDILQKMENHEGNNQTMSPAEEIYSNRERTQNTCGASTLY